jgi:hypothetical protein
MPKVDGFRVLSWLKSHPELKTIRHSSVDALV